MNELRNIIDSFEVTRPNLGRKTLNRLIAQTEQVIYDRLNTNREITDTDGAAALLAKIHAGESQYARVQFETYLSTLQNLKYEDKFTVQLTDLMKEINQSENPAEVMINLIKQERASGLITEQNILPENFFTERIKPLPDQMGPANARFREEFIEEPSLFEKAKGKINEFLRPADLPAPQPPEYLYFPEEIEMQALQDSGWNLRKNDYIRISEYFKGDRYFSELSETQAKLVESLRYSPEEFENTFSKTGDTAMYHEMRTQLKDELLDDSVLSKAELDSFEGIQERFAVNAEEFNVVKEKFAF